MLARFERSLDALPSVLQAVSTFCAKHGADKESSYALAFAVEEIFTNMVKYNPSGPRVVGMNLEAAGTDAVITMEDEQESGFDLREAPEPAFEKPLAERKPGGLGIFLIKKMIRDVQVTRVANKNSIILTHPLEHV